jgi:hypothetical protein
MHDDVGKYSPKLTRDMYSDQLGRTAVYSGGTSSMGHRTPYAFCVLGKTSAAFPSLVTTLQCLLCVFVYLRRFQLSLHNGCLFQVLATEWEAKKKNLEAGTEGDTESFLNSGRPSGHSTYCPSGFTYNEFSKQLNRNAQATIWKPIRKVTHRVIFKLWASLRPVGIVHQDSLTMSFPNN